MDWTQVAGQLAQAGLPSIGTLIGNMVGGPLGGSLGGSAGRLAASAVAAALGVPPTPEAVSQAVAADPGAAQVKLAMIEADAKIQADYLADLASARAMETAAIQSGHSIAWVPVAFSVLNYIILAVVIAGVALSWLREDGIIVGFALGAATSAMNFWLGSSESSKRNADTVRQVVTTTTGPVARVTARR